MLTTTLSAFKKFSWGLIMLIWPLVSQSQSDTLQFTAQKTSLARILMEAEKQSGYRFFYSNEQINLDKQIRIKSGIYTIHSFMDEISSRQKINYLILGNQIVLTPSRPLLSIQQKSQENDHHNLRKDSILISLSSRYTSTNLLTGKVFDAENNQPLPGVNITIQGTYTGIATSADGSFSLHVPDPNVILQVSCIGYRSKSIKLEGKLHINIGLDAEAKPLDEVIIMGYGEIKKEDLMGAISSIEGRKINKLAGQSFTIGLQGKIPGLMAVQSSGRPGAPVSVKIRGLGTVNNAEPLYVIDGIPLINEVEAGRADNPLNFINPDDIESLEVLKDAAATSIYGSRGANGIILVNTNRGKSGKTKVRLDASFGESRRIGKLDILDTKGYIRFLDSLYTWGNADGIPDTLLMAYQDPSNLKQNTNWQDALTRKAHFSNYFLGISGGGIHNNFSISAGYMSQEGIMRGTDFQRISFSVNSDYSVKKFSFGESFHLSFLSQDRESNSYGAALEASPLMPLYDKENLGGFAGPDLETTGENTVTNVLAENLLRLKRNENNRIFGGIFGEYQFTNWLSYRINLGGDYAGTLSTTFAPAYDLGRNGETGIRGNATSYLFQSRLENKTGLIENLLHIRVTESKYNLSILAGHSAQLNDRRFLQASATNVESENDVIIHSDRPDVSIMENIQEWRLLSYIGRAMLTVKNRYLFSGSIRCDGSSRFGPTNRFGWFPSVSAAWKISEEDFFQLKGINYLKFRLSYGISGNQEIGNYGYSSEVTTTNSFYVFGTDQILLYGGTPLLRYGNRNIKWESNLQSNAGIDLGLFGNRLLLSYDYYYRITDGMLVRIPVSGLSGYLQSFADPYINAGVIVNKGSELSLSFRHFWDTKGIQFNANITTIHNKVTDLNESIIKGGFDGETVTLKGYPAGSFYGYKTDGIFQSEQEILQHAYQSDATRPGDVRFVDINKDNKITSDDRTVIGNAIPHYIFGSSIDYFFEDFDFSINFQGVADADIYNYTRRRLASPSNLSYAIDHNKSSEVFDYWRIGNSQTHVSRIVRTDVNGNDRISDRWIEDGSYLRIKQLEMGYSFGSKFNEKFSLNRFRIYFAIQNALTLTQYSGMDPEFGPESPTGHGGEPILQNGIDRTNYPMSRTFIIGFQLFAK